MHDNLHAEMLYTPRLLDGLGQDVSCNVLVPAIEKHYFEAIFHKPLAMFSSHQMVCSGPFWVDIARNESC